MAFARVPLLLAAAAAGFLLVRVGIAAADPSAENGKSEFVKHGCWQCHGFEGQGSVASSGGVVIADTQLPFEAFKAYVRDPGGAMPPFHAEILSDSDLADIYAYLESRPKPQPAKDIPLLNNLSVK
ncbi:MAG: c-type cytochrome [Xanthobacteraceae bacterium]